MCMLTQSPLTLTKAQKQALDDLPGMRGALGNLTVLTGPPVTQTILGGASSRR